MKESQLESSIFNFKVGRQELHADDFSVAELEKSILKGQFDVCRIKLFGGKKDLLENLNKLGYPYEIYTINYYNTLNIKDKPRLKRDDMFSIREVSCSKEDLEFLEILEEVLAQNEWIEYKSTLSNNVMPVAQRQELAKAYYSTFCRDERPNTYTGVLNKEGKGIGIFMGEFKNDSFHGAIFGLRAAFRSKGYAKYFYDFMCEICQAKGIQYFVDEVNIFNLPSQQSALSQNLVPKKVYFNISIFPFYHFKDKIFCEMRWRDYGFSAIVHYLDQLFPEFYIKSSNAKRRLEDFDWQIDKVVQTCPLITQQEVFIVFHFLNKDKIKESYYLHLIKKS